MKVTVCYKTVGKYSITYDDVTPEQREEILEGIIPDDFANEVMSLCEPEGDWDDEIWMENIQDDDVDWGETEICPDCETENFYPGYNAEETGCYIKTCKHCGKEIFLCDACFHSKDNPNMVCDWHENEMGHGCFRDWIKKGE